MITFRDFIIFLAEHHCLGLYWANLEIECDVRGIRRFNQHLDLIFSGRPRGWLTFSFNWPTSKEGAAYWNWVDDCWRERCKEMNGAKN